MENTLKGIPKKFTHFFDTVFLLFSPSTNFSKIAKVEVEEERQPELQ
jgi:hypothetical protein